MSTELAKQDNKQVALGAPRATDRLSAMLGIAPGQMVETIKATCFKLKDGESVSNEQLAAFCSIAADLGVNPLLPGMMYAYPSKGGGIVPMIGPDGVFALLSRSDEIDSWGTEPEYDGNGKLIACTATIKRKGRGPISKRVLLSEWRVSNNPNWESRPTHMLEIRALKQCARMVIHGLPYDEDERRIIEAQAVPAESRASVVQEPGETRSKAVAKKLGAPAAPHQQPQVITVEAKPLPKGLSPEDRTAAEALVAQLHRLAEMVEKDDDVAPEEAIRRVTNVAGHDGVESFDPFLDGTFPVSRLRDIVAYHSGGE